jgi:hypothetical protein
MRWRDIPFHPTRQTLRVFALGLALLLGGVATWQFLTANNVFAALLLGGLALVVGILGWAFPTWVRPVFVGWLILVFPVNWLLSHVLLGLIFFLLVTPLGLFFRLIGRDVLGRRGRPDQETYWVAKPHHEEAKRYLQPF